MRAVSAARIVQQSSSRLLVSIVVLLSFLVALAGCSDAAAPIASQRRIISPAPARAAAPAASYAQPPAAASAASPQGVPVHAPANAAQSSAAQADVLPLDRMVIRNARLSLQVNNVESALAQVRQIADTNGGYVMASHTSLTKQDGQDRMTADVTIAVRSDAYDRAVQSIRQLAKKVESEDGTSQDVTQEYVDTSSELKNLQTTQAALLKLMDKAQTLNDTLTLQQQLTSVQGQIDRLEGRKRYLEHQTSLASIAVSLQLPPAASGAPKPAGWSPSAAFVRGWQNSLVLLEAVAGVAIEAVGLFWWLIPLGALGYYVYQRRRPVPTASTRQ